MVGARVTIVVYAIEVFTLVIELICIWLTVDHVRHVTENFLTALVHPRLTLRELSIDFLLLIVLCLLSRFFHFQMLRREDISKYNN